MRAEPRVRVRNGKVVKEHVNPVEVRLVVLDPGGSALRAGDDRKGPAQDLEVFDHVVGRDSGARRCRQGRPRVFEAADVPSAGRLAATWSWNSAGLRADSSPTRTLAEALDCPAWLERPARSGIREARRAGGRRWPDTARRWAFQAGASQAAILVRNSRSGSLSRGWALPGRRFVAIQPARIQRGDQAQGDAANLEVEAEDLILLEIPPLEHEVGPLAHPVDHLDAGVQALEIMGRFQVARAASALRGRNGRSERRRSRERRRLS